MLGLTEESVELPTREIEGTLLVLPAVMDQRSAVIVDHVADKLFREAIFLREGSLFTSRMISPPSSQILST